MKLRFSIAGTVAAGAYAAEALFMAMQESRGQGCMGWCMGVATFPEFLLLGLLPTSFFYTEAWNHFLIWVYLLGSVGLNAFILYVIFGGVAWWRGL